MNAQIELALDKYLTAQGFTPRTCQHCKFHEVQIRSGLWGRTWTAWGCKQHEGMNVSLGCSCGLWEEKDRLDSSV